MLSIPAAWTTAMMRPGCEPAFLLNFELRQSSTGATKNIKIVTGQRNLLGYPASGHDVKSIAMRIDPVGRNFSISDVQVSLVDDGYWRDLLQTYYAAGKKITVKLGCAELTTEGDWQSYGSVTIRDMRVEPGAVHLICRDAGGLLRDAQIGGSWVSRHPLEALEMILQDASISTARYDATTLDATAYTATHSHYRVSRADTRGIVEPINKGLTEYVSAKELVEELVFLLGGTFAPDHDDVWSYKDYNGAAAAVASLTAADISDLRVKSTWELMYNRVSVGAGSAYEGQSRLQFVQDDSNSQSILGEQGQPRILAYSAQSPWLNQLGSLVGELFVPGSVFIPSTAGPGDTFFVAYAHENGFAGVDYNTPMPRSTASTPIADFNLSAARPGYFWIRGPGVRHEIIKVDAVISSTLVQQQYETRSTSPFISASDYGGITKFQIAARAQFGTKQYTHSGALVYDITIPVAIASRILNRFTSGAQVIEVSTSLDFFGLELGDIVQITDDVPLAFARDGSTTSEGWEVIGKDIRVLDDTPRVVLTLCWASSTAVTWTAGFTEIASPPPRRARPAEPFFFQNGTPVELVSNELLYALTKA